MLQEQIDGGGRNEIKIDRNISVVDGNGDEMFRLPQILTWPDSIHLDVKVDENDTTKLVVRLKKKKETASEIQELDKCKKLKCYFKWQKGSLGCRYSPHRYPPTPEWNLRRPHRLAEKDLRYLNHYILA